MQTPSLKPPLLERLAKTVLVADGAMGTMVAAQSPHDVECIEALSRTDPDLIADIHRQYVRAGASIIETNTFGANRIALARFGLADETKTLIREAVRLARTEAGREVYVAGSVGPIRFMTGDGAPDTNGEAVAVALNEQLGALIEAGVDCIIFETYTDSNELVDAVRSAKTLAHLPVIASMTASRLSGPSDELAGMGRRLIEAGADCIGLNCGQGIRAVESALDSLVGLGVPVSVMPNAGFPERVAGRLRFGASEEYFAGEAVLLAQKGARIIGGCCGTTPSHIEAVARALRAKKIVFRARTRPATAETAADAPYKEGRLLSGFSTVKLPIICEIDPPATRQIERNMDAVRAVFAAGANALSLADNPLATVKIENLAFAAHIKKALDVPVILHVTGRDRNLLGLQSFMLGAALTGVEGLLCITGDPSTQPGGPTNVFDVNSLGLLKMAATLNRGKNLLGKDIGAETDFSLGGAVNPGVADLTPQIRHLRNKVAAGARFVMTQPVYDAATCARFIDAVRDLGIRVFVGVLPVLSSRTAEYLHHEVPGISVPESLRNDLKKRDDPVWQEQAGIDHAKDLIREIVPHIDGLYLIAPHTRPSVLAPLVTVARESC